MWVCVRSVEGEYMPVGMCDICVRVWGMCLCIWVCVYQYVCVYISGCVYIFVCLCIKVRVRI